jgi:hypothetical protein
MEKTERAKITPMKGVETGKQPEKMSYEQIVDIANQLQSQNRELMMRMQGLVDVYHRLDYLFKVIENASQFEAQFAQSCAAEIQDIITIPKEESEKSESSEETK